MLIETKVNDRYCVNSEVVLYCFAHAAMAELVDALDSGSSRGNSVDVRVILAAITP